MERRITLTLEAPPGTDWTGSPTRLLILVGSVRHDFSYFAKALVEQHTTN